MALKIGQKIIDKIRGKKPQNSKARYVIHCHPLAASAPESMKPFADWVLAWTNLKPKTVFEIGANYGQDAEGLRQYFGLANENVWAFEAHPDICEEAKKLYKFKIFNCAVFNENKDMTFNVVDLKNTKNSGISSLYNRSQNPENMKQILVKAIRMDDFLNEQNIDKVDFLKLDAEGCNWEVLDGFGDRLKDVNLIHIESEHTPIWDGQKLFKDIETKLLENGFEMVYFQRYSRQSDSFWINKSHFTKANI